MFGPERRTELRRKRDENLETVFVLLIPFDLPGLRGSGGIFRNHDTVSMLCVERGNSGRN